MVFTVTIRRCNWRKVEVTQQSTERRKLFAGVTRVLECEQGTQRNAIKQLTARKFGKSAVASSQEIPRR